MHLVCFDCLLFMLIVVYYRVHVVCFDCWLFIDVCSCILPTHSMLQQCLVRKRQRLTTNK